MRAIINVSTAQGKVSAPPSKSLAHRYIISAALSEGTSVISNVQFSEDIKATISCIKTLGADATVDGSTVTVKGNGGKWPEGVLEFNCNESGSTMRFFMGIAMITGRKSYFYGSETLRNRPFGVYEDICKDQGVTFTKEENRILIDGTIKAGIYKIPGNISSQFISGLLFALPLLSEDSVIELIPPVESINYIDLTIQALRAFNVDVKWGENYRLEIKGAKEYVSADTVVEGDFSNAAFLDAFNTIGGQVETEGLNNESLQGDKVYREYFEELVKGHATLDISDCPDLGPILMSVAAANHGGLFTGTRRLKIKESNRGLVMCEELKKFGVGSRMEENEIEINGNELKAPTEALDGHNDHRIVMSMSFLCTITGGQVNGVQAVRKSYPEFFDVIKNLGIEVKLDEMD